MRSEKTSSGLSEGVASKPRVDRLAQEIGRRIADARNGLGLSQAAVHTRSKLIDPEGSGVSRATLSLYEIGTNKPGAREITLLCEVLHVSPNWLLYGSDSPAKAVRPTTQFLSGDDLQIATRLAFAMLALSSVDRESLANLVFSLLSGRLSDMQLSSLMAMANMLRESLLREITDTVENAQDMPLSELIDRFVDEMGDAVQTNYGNLRPTLTEDELSEGQNFAPPRTLK